MCMLWCTHHDIHHRGGKGLGGWWSWMTTHHHTAGNTCGICHADTEELRFRPLTIIQKERCVTCHDEAEELEVYKLTQTTYHHTEGKMRYLSWWSRGTGGLQINPDNRGPEGLDLRPRPLTIIQKERHVEIANDVWIQTLKFSQHRVMCDKQGEAAHLQKTKFNVINMPVKLHRQNRPHLSRYQRQNNHACPNQHRWHYYYHTC